MSLRTNELDYELPTELIAIRPAEPRDAARLLVLHRSDDRIDHRLVRDIPEFLRLGDLMVFNNTSVIPARLQGRRIGTNGRVEGLFIQEQQSEPVQWKVMLKAGGRLREGDRIELLDAKHSSHDIRILLVRRDAEHWIAELAGSPSTSEALARIGLTPLPPYILRARGDVTIEDAIDRQWYQTVYAQARQQGSVAAPTAGLHFTSQLIDRIDQVGAKRVELTLNVGQGTFQPVTAETLAGHRMHSESYEISEKAVEVINSRTGRLIAVGTTSVRTLESAASQILASKTVQKCGGISGMTDLLIAPPYEFRLVQGMLTNFHLPRSTLLALVAAMIGLDRLKLVYQEAIKQGYRFYSYGDAMLILP